MKILEAWHFGGWYEKFEKMVCVILSFFVALVILCALYKLGFHLFHLLVTHGVDPLDHKAFKTIFGMIMILLIALEFKHSIVKVIEKDQGIVQVKTVLLIAILAISRKMIILDTKSMSPLTIFSLAAVILALGAVYWLIRDRDDRVLGK
ncbi:MAG: phosphate-starvation-inducible PsiE family protein [Thermodesulfobacteria bacterium]|nr:phosphate-starvation-inducible PsiE family protein [Thermodesulfobacteriota bacterium]